VSFIIRDNADRVTIKKYTPTANEAFQIPAGEHVEFIGLDPNGAIVVLTSALSKV
jgi:hypothetical protein